jgi:hypothetical protein
MRIKEAELEIKKTNNVGEPLHCTIVSFQVTTRSTLHTQTNYTNAEHSTTYHEMDCKSPAPFNSRGSQISGRILKTNIQQCQSCYWTQEVNFTAIPEWQQLTINTSTKKQNNITKLSFAACALCVTRLSSELRLAVHTVKFKLLRHAVS